MSPDSAAVEADLLSLRFRVGANRGHWRVVSHSFPVVVVEVAATEPDGTASAYCFRFELTGFPTSAPEVILWDPGTNSRPAAERRPQGTQRVLEAFKDWTAPHSVYRPWDRHGAAHGDWSQRHPELLWRADRDLTFILEDLHGLLNSNDVARGLRQTA